MLWRSTVVLNVTLDIQVNASMQCRLFLRWSAITILQGEINRKGMVL